jgi:hypothetical protein
MSVFIVLVRWVPVWGSHGRIYLFIAECFLFFPPELEANHWTLLGLRMRIIYKSNQDLCTTVPNSSITFVTGHLSRLNGTSDWYLKGHGFKYGAEDRQPSVLVRNAAMAPKTVLFFFTQRALESNTQKSKGTHVFWKAQQSLYFRRRRNLFLCRSI